MRHDLHTYIPATEATTTASLSDAPFYPEDLLPALQDTLAALADLEEWSGPEEEMQCHRAELEQLHRQAREPLLRHLAGLQEEAKPIRPFH